jgi:type IV pilus assembly protein PilB
MKHLEKLTRKHLGEMLVDEGLISKNQLVDAEREHQATGDPLGPILVEANYITDWDLAKTVASQYQLPFVEIHTIAQAKNAVGIFLPEEQQKHRIYPLDRIGNVLTIAVADMPSIEFLRGIQERTGLTPFLFVALLTEIQRVISAEQAAAAGPAKTAASAEPEPVAEQVHEISVPGDAASPAELSEEDWQQGLSIFDEAAEGDAEQEKAPEPRPETPAGQPPADWHNIFDTANESVLKEIDRE